MTISWIEELKIYIYMLSGFSLKYSTDNFFGRLAPSS